MGKSFKEIAVARDGGSTIFEYDGRTFFLDWGIGSSTHGYIFHGRDRSGATVHEDLYKEIRPLFSERFAKLKPVNSATESDPGVGQYYEKAHGTGMYFPEKQIEDLKSKLDAANQTINDLKHAIIDGTNLASGIGWDGERPEIEKVREQLDAANNRIKELEQWKQEEILVFGRILDYCQDDENAKRLGIGLGQSISTRIIEILKDYK